MTSDHAQYGPPGQIVLTSQSLREHAATLRAWSRAARDRSQASRDDAQRRRSAEVAPCAVPSAPAGSDAPVEPGPPVGDVAPVPLGPVPLTELFVMLVDDHGLSVTDAVRGLAVETAVAGYPPDVDSISAADAFDVILAILHRPT